MVMVHPCGTLMNESPSRAGKGPIDRQAGFFRIEPDERKAGLFFRAVLGKKDGEFFE